jgi:hypothetical protein
MTSRLGSIVVAAFLGFLALLAVVAIVVLTDDESIGDDSAIVVPRISDGDVFLKDVPTEILITARANEAVSSISLLEDGRFIVRDARPVADAGQSTFTAALTWVPMRLGFVTLTIRALTVSGEETDREIRVEVTDDPSRLAQEIQVGVRSPVPGDLVAVDAVLTVVAEARSEEPIVTFILEVGGARVDETVARETAPGQSSGILAWTPRELGPATLTVLVRTANGDEETASVSIEVVTQDQAAVAAEEVPETDDSIDAANPDAGVGSGQLIIQNPTNATEFSFSENLTIGVSVVAIDTDPLVTIELYVNTVLFANVEPQRLADGSYRLTVPFQPSAPGIFRLEVVAISQSNRRFDDFVDIAVTGEGAAQEGMDEDEDVAADLPDLTPVSVTVGENNAVVVTIANIGQVPVISVPILISVIRASDSILLDEASVVVSIPAGSSRTIALPVFLSEAIDVTVVVDTAANVEEADETNNELTSKFAPARRPDLVAQGLELSVDRIAIVRVANVGASAFSGTINVRIVFNGATVEDLQFSGSLAVQGSLTLSGTQPIEGEGQLSAIVDPANQIAEANEGNNAVAIVVTP